MADTAVTAVSAALVLVEKVLSYLNQKTVEDDVEDIINWLRSIKAYLTDIDGNEGTEVIRERVKQIRDVANHIEDVIEELMFHAPDKFHSHKITKKAHKLAHKVRLWKHDMPSKIAKIKKKINNIITLDQLVSSIGVGTTNFEKGWSSGLRMEHQDQEAVADEEIVGFEETREALTRQLTDGGVSNSNPRHMTISVVGPGGSGKTFLVKNVYESKRIWRQFDCRAWVQVSQSSNVEVLLCSMLRQFCSSREESIPSESIGTGSKLKKYLQQKRYVVVLDDIGKEEVWQCIQKVLPCDSSISSRVIITTQKSDVATSCVESPDCIHELKGLKWSNAWDLFCKKAFKTTNPNERCPPELDEWSRKFVTRCDGLPLAIVGIGSLLSKKQQIPSEWKKVYDSLGSGNLSIVSNILLPSYKDLPTNLKSCFLYFSFFPKGHLIERGRLVRLWIAEGFVSGTIGHQTLEEVAEHYLNELIGRNLVHTDKRDFDGRPRYCRVLNLVHEFITQKSKEMNFISVLPEQADTSSRKMKVRRLPIENDYCIDSSRHIDKSYIDWSYVRSAFFLFKISPSIGDILRDFKLLGVLDLRDAPLDKFPADIVRLILLRYLCLRNTNIKEVPKSIKKLKHLETLDLRQTNVTKLPKGIRLLHKLRHLLVCCCDDKQYVIMNTVRGVELFEGVGTFNLLQKLQKLSFVKPDKHQKIIKELGALIQLRKLGIIELKREGGKHLCASIQKMRDLSTLDVSSTSKDESLDLDDMDSPPPHLQRLYLKGHLLKLPGWISSLRNLFRIGLMWSRLKLSPLEVLQELPNLMELQMADAFTGSELVFKSGTFKKLKVLRIEQFDHLNKVKVEEGSMSVLQNLTISNCVNLKILPSGINKLTCLEELLLYSMPREFIGHLQKKNEDREMVNHIHVIHSFVRGANGSWSLDQNLS